MKSSNDKTTKKTAGSEKKTDKKQNAGKSGQTSESNKK